MVDAPAGARQLGDHHAAVGVDLGDRIAEVVESRHLLAAGIGETAAGHLSRALEQVSGQRSHGQLVAVVVGPAEVMQRRREEQRGDADPAGNRSEERRVGEEGVSTCSYRWSSVPEQQKKEKSN